MLRLVQWQLQRCLNLELAEAEQNKPAKRQRFEVQVRPDIQLNEFSRLKPAILIRTSGRQTDSVDDPGSLPNAIATWIIDITQKVGNQRKGELYAQANIPNYWSLDIENVELHLYQQPSHSGYSSHRVLQVGDQASPVRVPLTVRLQEPTPLHFMTRTLNGQQTYESYALPFSFTTCR